MQIWDQEVPGEPRTPALERLSEVQVGQVLRRVQEFPPRGNKLGSGKTSLAGVQDKIVLAQDQLSRLLQMVT